MGYRFRARAASLLDLSHPEDRASRWFDMLIVGLILINVVAVVLESVVELRLRWAATFYWIEIISVAVFTLEYLTRVWSIVENKWRPEYRHPLWGRLRFMRSPMAIIDLLAVAPFWLSMFVPMDLRFLRVVRLLRVLKLTRYSAAMNLLFDVLRDEARVIGAAMFSLFLVLMLTASATYLAENAVQPEDFANVPQAMWWAIITVTTVGYGDVVPVTPVGKFFGAFLAVVGVGMVALPAGILASGFSDALSRRRNSLRRETGAALHDGVIDAEERQHLVSRGESLSLSEDEVSEIIQEKLSENDGELACPHCGCRFTPGETPQAG